MYSLYSTFDPSAKVVVVTISMARGIDATMSTTTNESAVTTFSPRLTWAERGEFRGNIISVLQLNVNVDNHAVVTIIH